MAKWVVTAKGADYKSISGELGVDQVIARIMRNRGLNTVDDMKQFLGGREEDCHDPMLLNDMDLAVKQIIQAIDVGKKIRVIGDYDVDGVTATYILYKGLTSLGGDVDYAIPNRVTDGYGVNDNLINAANEAGVDMIITCDNGIAAVPAIELAKSLGMQVIVTDHHEVPFELDGDNKKYIYPPADVIINPKRHDSTYPFSGICGAMVAYKLMLALSKVKAIDIDIIHELRELAGFGTVCDVMELMDENRIIVKLALDDMNNSHNIGIRALRQVCEIDKKPVAAFHLGFILGPCINATGRLDDASLSLKLLCAEDYEEAVLIATELRRLNELRKLKTEDGIKKAYEIIDSGIYDENKVLVIYIPELHESLAGIVAGRVREKYYKPTLVITKGEDGLKGSGRSIEAYDMHMELSKVSDVFIKFGGHKMAAGVSLEEDKLDELRDRLNANCSLTTEDMEEKICIDVPMPMSYVTESLVNELEILEPFGVGNPKPVFADRKVRLLSARTMGKTGDMAKFTATTEAGGRYELILFNGLGKLKEDIIAKYGEAAFDNLFSNGYGGPETTTPVIMNVIYYPGINEFRGNRILQYVISDYMISD